MRRLRSAAVSGTIALGANAEYDVGRCSETDLQTIWAVGDLAAERARGEGCPWEPGPSIVIFKMESDGGGAFRDDREIATGAQEQTAKRILNESWDDIVRLARLLAEGRTLSRAEIEAELEAEVFRLSELKDALGDGR